MRLQTLAASLALLCAALLASTTATADPTRILADARQAAGGPALDAVRSLHFIETLQADGVTGPQDTWQDVETGRFLHTTNLPPAPRSDGFDGISAWYQGLSGIAYRLGDVDARLNAANESYRTARAWWFADRHAATVAAAGTAQEGGRHFDILQITPEGGRAFTLWIDSATHLIDRTIEQQAEDRVVTRYADYRRVGGVMLPFTIRTGDGGDPSDDAVETVQRVELNAAIPDARFSMPAAPPADTEIAGGGDSVTVPIRLDNNKILVPVSINGAPPIGAEFDSGGSLILQPALLADLKLSGTAHAKEEGGGEGSVTASRGLVGSISIGGATMRNLAFHSFDFSAAKPKLVLVGQETLQRFVVSFDFDQMTMTLTEPKAFRACGRGTVIPFQFQDNQPEITGTVDGVAGLFTIDTGDSGSLLLIAPFAQRYGFAQKLHAVFTYSGRAIAATHGLYARAHTVTFDGADGRPVEHITRPVTRISTQHAGFDADRDVSANIGLGILKQFNLTFDYAHQQIILERNHFYGMPDIFNRAGLRLEQQGDGWVVAKLYPNSPAADAGMKAGDSVQRVNGITPDRLGAGALDQLLKGPIGSEVVLQSGKKTMKLKLRDIL
jgi:hypothetical protein